MCRSYLANALRPHVTHMETDAMGNLIAFKAGRKRTGSKLLLDAHMDEVGIMVSGYTADGCLRFSFVGGVDRRVVIGKTGLYRKRTHFGCFWHETGSLVHERGAKIRSEAGVPLH